MALKYKIITVDEEKGIKAIVINDKGFPVIEDDEGKEFGLDALGLYTQVPELREEAKKHRLKANDLAKQVKLLADAGVDLEALPDWVEDATKALDTIKNLDDKKLVDANKVEIIKTQAQENLKKQLSSLEKSKNEQINSLEEALKGARTDIHQLMVNDRFNSSEFVKEKMAITPKMAQRYFGGQFKVEDGDNGNRSVIAYYPNGEPVYSMEKAGAPAEFDEALQLLVDNDPDRDRFLKGLAAAGGGAQGGDKGGGGGQYRMEENPWKDGEHFNLTKQAEIMNQNPTLAKQMQSEAGVAVE